MEDHFVTVRTYHDYITAQLILNALHDAGITTFHSTKAVPLPPTDEYHIMVPEHEVDNAIDVIEKNEEF